jgi:hypothetical protein
VLDRLGPNHDIADRQLRRETAGRTSADYEFDGRKQADQILGLNRELRLAMAARRDQGSPVADTRRSGDRKRE